MKRTTILIFLALTLGGSSVYAQLSDKTLNLITEFQQASKTRDDAKIRTVFKELKANREAVTYMKENMPKTYNAFVLRDLAIRVDDLRRESGLGNIPTEISTTGGARQTGNQAKDSVTNDNRNGTQPPNHVVVDNAERAQGRPNQDIVESFSNRRQALELNNQDRIRRLGRRNNR